MARRWTILMPLCGVAVAALVGRAGPVRAAMLEGRVVAAEGLSEPPALSVALDAWACAPDGKVPDPRLRIGADRGLADVVVHVKVPEAPAYSAEGEVLIDQKACVFTPHAVVVAPGQDLRVRNSDPVLHNFHTIAQHNRTINRAQVKGKEDTFRFETPEIVRAECDVHYWMSAVVVVAEDAYTTLTGADGSFRLEGVPPGTYTADLWHQTLGSRSVSVEVGADGGRLDASWDAPTPSP